jgi:DNA-binding winged helix-turn-helix (wHTH) protein
MEDSWRFGAVEVRPAQRQVLVDGRPAGIGARAFDVLLMLLVHRDRVVSKDELLDGVWAGLVVEENNLQVQISALRRLLGAGAIATVPARGYRFVAVPPATPPHRLPPPPARCPPRRCRACARPSLAASARSGRRWSTCAPGQCSP